MPEFMGKGEYVATATGPIQQKKRMRARDGISAEGAWPFAMSHRRIDPVLVDERVHYAG